MICQSCEIEFIPVHGKSKFCIDCKFSKRSQDFYRLYKYGLSTQQYEHLIQKQRGLCAICEKLLNKPHIDHCHLTGRVRGLLCKDCNNALGLFREDVKIMRSAIDYIENCPDPE
jgi:Recombination endonuclease VII